VFVENMTICNDSSICKSKKTHTIIPIGLPTEAALKTLVEKIGAYDKSFNRSKDENVD